MPTTLELDDAEVAALLECADREGVSVRAVVRVAIHEYLERPIRAESIDPALDGEAPRMSRPTRRLADLPHPKRGPSVTKTLTETRKDERY